MDCAQKLNHNSLKDHLVCITGATGFVGKGVIDRLLLEGCRIRVLTRNSTLVFPENVEVVIGNLTIDDNQLDKFLIDCTILINCAGEIHNISLMRSLHVYGTLNLLRRISKIKIENQLLIHWVQVSSVGAYGPQIIRDIERLIDEDSPVSPVGEYEITKTIADELLIKAHNEGVITCSILRPSNIFGLGMKNQSLLNLIGVINKGLFFYIGKPGAILTYVHINDVVEAIFLSCLIPKAKGKIYNLSADCKLETLVDYISLALGNKLPRIRIPECFIRKVVKFVGWTKLFPLTISRVNALTCRTRYSSNKIINELNFSFSKPMPKSVDELLYK